MRLSVKAMRPTDPQRTQRRSPAQLLAEVHDRDLYEVDENCKPDQTQCVSVDVMRALLSRRQPLALQPVVRTKIATVAAMGFRHQDFRYLSPYGFRMPGCIYTYTFWIRFHAEGKEGPLDSLKNGYYAFLMENVKKRWWKVWTRRYSSVYRSALSGPFLLIDAGDSTRTKSLPDGENTPTNPFFRKESPDEEDEDIFEDAVEEQVDFNSIDEPNVKLLKESAREPKSHRIDFLEEFTEDEDGEDQEGK